MTSLMLIGLIVQDGTATGIPQSSTGTISEGIHQEREQDTPTADEDNDRERAITSYGRRGLSQVTIYTIHTIYH